MSDHELTHIPRKDLAHHPCQEAGRQKITMLTGYDYPTACIGSGWD